MKYIARKPTGEYLSTRKATGHMYVYRSQWGTFDECRVFNNKAAATNAARQAGEQNPEIIPVELKIKEENNV